MAHNTEQRRSIKSNIVFSVNYLSSILPINSCIGYNSRLNITQVDETRYSLLIDEQHTLTYEAIEPGVVLGVQMVGEGRHSLPEIIGAVRAVSQNSWSDIGRFLFFLRLLEEEFLLRYIVYSNDHFLSVSPQGPCTISTIATHSRHCYQFSQFVYLQMRPDCLMVQTPMNPLIIELDLETGMRMLPVLTSGASYSTLKELGCDEVFVKTLLSLALSTGFIHRIGDEPIYLKHWEFHDLLFHSRSRLGRATDKRCFGARQSVGDNVLPPVVAKERTGLSVELSKDLGLSPPSMSLQQALDRRRSRRGHNDSQPLDIGVLGLFLYRSLHLSHDGEGLRAPYASAGGQYENNLYISVRLCKGLQAGLFQYDVITNSLTPIANSTAVSEAVMRISTSAWGEQHGPPQIVILLTANLAAMAAKYRGIAYRNLLLNAGGLLQTFYLVATDMSIAACALGYGHSTLLPMALGLEPLQLVTVAEFALGSA